MKNLLGWIELLTVDCWMGGYLGRIKGLKSLIGNLKDGNATKIKPFFLFII